MERSDYMDSQTTTTSKNESSHFVPLENYVTGLWKLGGLPLVLIGLGAVNLIYPNKGNYTETKRIVVTVFLFSAAILAWGSLMYLAFKR
jgi:predicted membrane channel-forming protein YqfA (hemolysin III family)